MPGPRDEVCFTLTFDNALFDKKAGVRPQREQDTIPRPEQAALHALFKQVYDVLKGVDMDFYCLKLNVDPEKMQWYPDVSAPRTFLDATHFCFGDITLRDYTYDNVTDTNTFLHTKRPGAATRRDLNRTLPTYIVLCAELFRVRFPNHHLPSDWSAGFTPVPFTQLAFMLACAARLQWATCKSDDRPARTKYQREDTPTLPAGLAPQALLDHFLVDVDLIRAEITAPPAGDFATYVFEDNGMRVDEKAPLPIESVDNPEIARPRALLVQLRCARCGALGARPQPPTLRDWLAQHLTDRDARRVLAELHTDPDARVRLLTRLEEHEVRALNCLTADQKRTVWAHIAAYQRAADAH
jgi:hypothetical protein